MKREKPKRKRQETVKKKERKQAKIREFRKLSLPAARLSGTDTKPGPQNERRENPSRLTVGTIRDWMQAEKSRWQQKHYSGKKCDVKSLSMR